MEVKQEIKLEPIDAPLSSKSKNMSDMGGKQPDSPMNQSASTPSASGATTPLSNKGGKQLGRAGKQMDISTKHEVKQEFDSSGMKEEPMNTEDSSSSSTAATAQVKTENSGGENSNSSNGAEVKTEPSSTAAGDKTDKAASPFKPRSKKSKYSALS